MEAAYEDVSKTAERLFNLTENPLRLADLYDQLMERDCTWMLPHTELVDIVGKRYGGMPMHATLTISAGVEHPVVARFPEHTLVQDLASAYNAILKTGWQLDDPNHDRTSSLKDSKTKSELFSLIIEQRRNERSCLLSCYHLLEGYLNALAFERIHAPEADPLTEEDELYLQQRRRTKNGIKIKFVSLKKKVLNFPIIIAGREDLPLDEETEPLKTIVDTAKILRDSIVHPSPFAAPERFGGYDKLKRIKNLDFAAVDEAVEATFEIIRAVHQFVGDSGDEPDWLPDKLPNKRFLLTHLPTSKL